MRDRVKNTTIKKCLVITNFVFLILLWLPIWTHVEYHESVYYILLIGIISNGVPTVYDTYKKYSKKAR